MAAATHRVLILKSDPKGRVSKDEGTIMKTSWFETRRSAALLTMRYLSKTRI